MNIIFFALVKLKKRTVIKRRTEVLTGMLCKLQLKLKCHYNLLLTWVYTYFVKHSSRRKRRNTARNMKNKVNICFWRINQSSASTNLRSSRRTRERTQTTCRGRHFEFTADQMKSSCINGRGAWWEVNKMAALSARCVRSLARVSVQISVSNGDQQV